MRRRDYKTHLKPNYFTDPYPVPYYDGLKKYSSPSNLNLKVRFQS